ncbi:MAG: [FeFe] hydrogenase H-cluster maturation GTPase HydF [Spirochaetaceae bacterium]|jgi:[FeFe] hydrogenase H-cluster maturation GTPase HydF|nr:[FeFe] hydrogenase H-cluster maturation GTPase HydF [Spirochaetaceae bacterium]
MGLLETPSGERVHIGFFGRRNAGKSSLVNAVTGQDLVIVSDIKGTTTDPVYKAMELLPLGPVLIMDTPGMDDDGPLGELRVRRAKQVLNKTDVAVLVMDATEGKRPEDEELIRLFREKQVKHILVYNKIDLLHDDPSGLADRASEEIAVSAGRRWHIDALKERIAALARTEEPKLRLVGDLIAPGDMVILVVPIDKAAPKGRLILPQQQTIRDILEADGLALVVKEQELRELLHRLEPLGKQVKLVITDSQVFAKVSADTPAHIPLTSFSILFARYKGFLLQAVQGVKTLDDLNEGDQVLIAEGCTHHRQCDDIGTVKLPRWIKQYTGKNLGWTFTSGVEFPEDLSPYRLVLHCGGCMLTPRELRYRQKCAQDQGAPFTNYGTVIAYMQGILKRSVALFPVIAEELNAQAHGA